MSDKFNTLNEFLHLLHVGIVTGEASFDIEDPKRLIDFLVDEKVLIAIKEPHTAEDFADLYDTVYEAILDSGEDLPDYLAQAHLLEDATVLRVLGHFNDYFIECAERQLMQVANEEGRYIVAVLPQENIEELVRLSAELDIPLVPIEAE